MKTWSSSTSVVFARCHGTLDTINNGGATLSVSSGVIGVWELDAAGGGACGPAVGTGAARWTMSDTNTSFLVPMRTPLEMANISSEAMLYFVSKIS